MRRVGKKRVLKALHDTKGAVYLAAKSLHCSPVAIYAWINKDPEIKEVKESYTEEVTDIAVLKLRQAVQAGEQWAVKFQLMTQGKGRGYGERVEVTGADGGPVEFVRIYVPENGRN